VPLFYFELTGLNRAPHANQHIKGLTARSKLFAGTGIVLPLLPAGTGPSPAADAARNTGSSSASPSPAKPSSAAGSRETPQAKKAAATAGGSAALAAGGGLSPEPVVKLVFDCDFCGKRGHTSVDCKRMGKFQRQHSSQDSVTQGVGSERAAETAGGSPLGNSAHDTRMDIDVNAGG
jgi:hypothetical protein